MSPSPETTRGIVRYAVKMILFQAVFGLILFLAAGRLDWKEGWAYMGLNLLTQVLSGLILIPIRPEMIAERSKMREGTKNWDRILAPAVAMLGPLVWMVTAGLDKRFTWSAPLPPWLWIASLGLGLLASLFVIWAMAHNAFFAATVRIQTDRGQSVVSSGPYAWVRHPGYLGSVVYDLFAPLMLGSWWAYVPVLVVLALIFVRTRLEDATLQAELPGYAEYAARVRWRLIPGLW